MLDRVIGDGVMTVVPMDPAVTVAVASSALIYWVVNQNSSNVKVVGDGLIVVGLSNSQGGKTKVHGNLLHWTTGSSSW
jgi:hypothetical protein